MSNKLFRCGLAAALILQSVVIALPLSAQTVAAARSAAVPVTPAVAPIGTVAPMTNAGLSLSVNLQAPTLQTVAAAPTLAASPAATQAQAVPTALTGAAQVRAIIANALGTPAASALPRASAGGLASAKPGAPAAAEAAPAGAVRQLASHVARQAEAQPAGRQAAPSTDLKAGALFDGQAAKPKEWTFMVFLNGHNNLDDFGDMNIKQMEKVGSNDRVNIVVQWASLGKPTKRMLIQKSSNGDVVSSPVLESLPSVDMGSAEELFNFVKWTVEHFPAQKYFIDIWNHGAGWHIKNTKGASPLDVSYDDQTGNHITTEQVGQVMRRVKELIGKPVDALGFDACLMAMAEVVAEVADSVRFFAGSEETEPGAGWRYDESLKKWIDAGPGDDGAGITKAIAEKYIAAYGRQATFSVMDLAKFPAFVEAAKALRGEIDKLDANQLTALRNAARATRRYAYSDYGDFLDMVVRAAKAPVAVLTAPVVEAFTKALKDLVIWNGASADRSGSNGISVWIPTSSSYWTSYGKRYVGLIWHKLTGWGNAVKRIAGVSEV